MVQTIPAREIDLRYLIDHFGLQRVRDPEFFPEWQTNLPAITDLEKQQLDKIKEGYYNLIEYPPVLENVVKLSIISPLLFIADFYLPPFHIKTEKSIQIQSEYDGITIEGRIDILLLKENFWATVIESKNFSFSNEEGLAQLLTYMLANPNNQTITYGLVTNGVDFQFVKLKCEETPKYSLSNKFILTNQGEDFYQVLQILKKLSSFVD
ncbi:type I restriction enzyme HsdR N-terminal domain-containing protein [Spirulina sp. CS-785/01]|uniref:type I restriction enzyme HsdR N-terminal domain-containing protein n=1 Tax=Spirulina sp. CS-785/01 TaxID=3021716 RepID=UPI0023309539|nr:type I restriction enzyme HsdR N-terminal domain-containing protein [Spirulina sp. CS-785/01]MDB9312211.1 type I restriction enzyme HsdR N-terminal domain-containing protein [Spirulina sp. CS-785/01]